MLKDVWDSFKDNIKERATNPFLGTFAVVWIVHNWQVVYAFFYFDKDWKLQQKIDYFNHYWSNKNFFWNLIVVALIAVGILIITYLFLGLSRLLSNYFENVLVPFIYSLSKGKTVTGEVHQQTLEQVDRWKVRFEEERKSKIELEEERDELEKRLKQSIEPENILKDENFAEIINIARSRFTKEDLEKTLLGVSKKYGFPSDDNVIDFLLKDNLIELDRRSGTNFYYRFSARGNRFKEQYFADKISIQ